MIKNSIDLGCIVLAGGKSSRFGKDKGSSIVGNKKMVSHVIETVQSIGINDILLITNQSQLYQEYKEYTYEDKIKNVGPLGGIYTGLSISKHQFNLVLACDIPLVDTELIQTVIKKFRPPISVLSYNNKIHPLIGIYSKESIMSIEMAISNNQLKLIELIKDLNGNVIQFESISSHDKTQQLLNVNTVDEYNLLSSILLSK